MGTRTTGSKRIGRLVPAFRDNYVEANHVGEDYHFEKRLAGDVELCFLRLNSPRCDELFAVRPGSNYDNRANRSFMTRVYKPLEPADHVVIVYNGLDETIFTAQSPEELFSFYDDLGIALAQEHILAILLPTPYHMNRALAYIDPELESDENRRSSSYLDLTIPTEALMARSWNIYRNHFQGFKETVELSRHLRPDLAPKLWPFLESVPSAVPERVNKFLRDAIVPSAKISLIGYSLGGLRALTEYLVDRHDAIRQEREPLFTACVAMNSGGALNVLPNPPWVDAQRWRSMIGDLLGQRFSDDQQRRTLAEIPEKEHRQATRYYAFLNDVFLGQAASLGVLGKAARETANGMLFVIGGGDDLVPLESIKRFAPAGGVTIFQVAGMGHLFPYDRAWRHWKKIVFDVITRFLDNRARTRIAESDYDALARFVSLLDHELSILHYLSDLENPVSFRTASEKLASAANRAARVLGDEWIRTIEARSQLSGDVIEREFLSYAVVLVDTLKLEVKREVVHPGLYKRCRRALLVGGWLTENYGPLQDAWEDVVRRDGEKIGDALLRLKVVRREDLELALTEQKRALDEIRRQMAGDFLGVLKRRAAAPVMGVSS